MSANDEGEAEEGGSELRAPGEPEVAGSISSELSAEQLGLEDQDLEFELKGLDVEALDETVVTGEGAGLTTLDILTSGQDDREAEADRQQSKGGNTNRR